MKKRTSAALLSALILAAAVFLTACGGDASGGVSGAGGTSGGGDPKYHIELTMSHVFGPEEPISVELEAMADRIRERTFGAVDIHIYGSAQLPVYKDSLQKVLEGKNWIAVEDPSYLTDYNMNFEALCAPLLFDTVDQYSFVCQSDTVLGLCRDIETAHNLHVLALDLNLGLRGVLADRPVTKPEDMAGMRIRVPDSSLYIRCLETMGAVPVPMSLSDALSAIEEGKLDGMDGTAAFCAEYAGEKNQFSRTKHMIAACGAYINSRVWDTIPEEDQIIINEEFSMTARKLTAQANGDADRRLMADKGCLVNEADTAAFREAAAAEYERMVREDGVTEGLIPLLRDMAAGYNPVTAQP